MISKSSPDASYWLKSLLGDPHDGMWLNADNVLANDNLKPGRGYWYNRSRDKAEKLFDLLKNEIDQRRLGTGYDYAAEGRMFLSFLALALRSELEIRMRESALLRSSSADELLSEMDKICSVKLSDGRHILLEITRKQRELLHKIGVNPPQIQQG